MKCFFLGWMAYGTAWLLFLNKCKKHIHMRIGVCHSHLFQCLSNQSSQCTFIRGSTCPTIDAFVGGLGHMTWNFFLNPEPFLGGVGYGNLHLRELATLKVVVCPRQVTCDLLALPPSRSKRCQSGVGLGKSIFGLKWEPICG